MCFGEVHTQLIFLQIDCKSHGIGITSEFEPFDFTLCTVVDTFALDYLLLGKLREQRKTNLLLNGLSFFARCTFLISIRRLIILEQTSHEVGRLRLLHFQFLLFLLFLFNLQSLVLFLLLIVVINLVESDVEGQQNVEWDPDFDVVGGFF